MGGKKIKEWSDTDKAWLRSRYSVDVTNGMVRFVDTGKTVPLFRINPTRKQYLAVSAKIADKWTKVRLHHLVWFFATGEQSLKMVDHKDGEQDTPWGNRFENLRQCTDKQNRANVARRGYRVKKDKAGNIIGYYASMTWKDSVTGKTRFKRSKIVETPELAEAIYWNWQRKHHKGFAFCGDVVVSCTSQVSVD